MTEIVAVLRNTISTFMATIKKVYRAHNIVKLFSIFKLLLKIVSAIESVCEFWQMFFFLYFCHPTCRMADFFYFLHGILMSNEALEP